MEELFPLLVLLLIGCFLSGPIALVISIIALNKSRTARRELPSSISQPAKAVPPAAPMAVDWKQYKITKVAEKAKQELTPETGIDKTKKKETPPAETTSLEQRIGTKWILIAGIVTVIFGVGFFLKYAYDNEWIGELGRVVIAAIAGLVALAVGEVTRRRGYGIVAKGVTALGFAILYAAVFASYRFYGLIDSNPAFILAILITTASMLYAVSLNEVVVAFLPLLGGFLTPVLLSTGENLPMPLFSYVLILSIGAMLCSYYRKWRAINLLAFIGTFLLYTAWFEKFYRPEISKAAEGAPEQIFIALGWLAVFFVTYLILPILYEIIKKVKAQKEDVLLILANAAVVFYYLWTILFSEYRTQLAFCCFGLCAVHLVMMNVIIKRCREDLNLRLALLVICLYFLTIAIPLYLKMYAIAMAWAVEAVILVIIGLRYRNICTQMAAGVAFLLSFGQLLHHLPIHKGAFRCVLNPAFGTWCFVAAAVLICHIIYRRQKESEGTLYKSLSQLLYAISGILLMTVTIIEWYCHCEYNLIDIPNSYFLKGMVIIFAVFPLLFIIRPICPQGLLCKLLASVLMLVGSLFTMASFTEFYNDNFLIFANPEFGIVSAFVVSLFAGAWLFNTMTKEHRTIFTALFLMAGIFVLWMLLTEQIYLYWYCKNRYGGGVTNWRFLSQMYISVMWAIYGAFLMTAGFWKNVKMLRYVALGLFVLLLAKVFIFDTSTVKNVYRIAAFLATGITLVAVSYLYQFLRKKGFFDIVLGEKNTDKQE